MIESACLILALFYLMNYAQIAQLVEQRTENPRVGGSIPPLGTIQIKVVKNINHTFENKTVVITGGSAGIGAATARHFHQKKANIAIIARHQDGLDQLKHELGDERILSIAMDVSDLTKHQEALSSIYEKFGSIDILINNAGLHHRGDIQNLNPNVVADMVDVNLKAPIALSCHVIPYLKQSKSPSIVMVGSLAGRAPLQGAATYSATKAGLRAFVFALGDELKHLNINVGIVSPGPVSTGFIMSNIDDVEDIVFSQPMSTPDDVATIILKLTSFSGEICIPKSSGYLTTISYLFPNLRRRLRPLFYKIGRKNKNLYR